MLNRLLHVFRANFYNPGRYRNLFKTIYNEKCTRIVEIGVFNGLRACQMINTAKISSTSNEIEYYGFDLFEELTAEELKKEFSKQPLSQNQVLSRIEKATGVTPKIYKGYSQETLPKFVNEMKGKNAPDFIFIDGGHAIETITSDWDNMRKLMKKETTVIFDDYYFNDEPEMEGFGCQKLVDGLDKEMYEVEILNPTNHFKKDWGTLNVAMAKVKLK